MGDERQEIVSNIIMIHAASCQQFSQARCSVYERHSLSVHKQFCL